MKITEGQLRRIIRRELINEMSDPTIEVINADTGELLTLTGDLLKYYVDGQELQNAEFETLRRRVNTPRPPKRTVTPAPTPPAASTDNTVAALKRLHAAAKDAGLDYWEDNYDYDISLESVAHDLAAGVKWSSDLFRDDWKLGVEYYGGDHNALINALAETIASM